MITEDQVEQLAIQWHGLGRNIEHRTLNIERRSEEKRSLAEEVAKPEHPIGRPFRAWNPVGDGTQGVALGNRIMPRWGVRRITP